MEYSVRTGALVAHEVALNAADHEEAARCGAALAPRAVVARRPRLQRERVASCTEMLFLFVPGMNSSITMDEMPLDPYHIGSMACSDRAQPRPSVATLSRCVKVHSS